MRTNIVIDPKLMREAMRLSGLPTKRGAVTEGLKLLVRFKRQEQLRTLRGKAKWSADLDAMRRDRKS